jgi:hypothetical protein
MTVEEMDNLKVGDKLTPTKELYQRWPEFVTEGCVYRVEDDIGRGWVSDLFIWSDKWSKFYILYDVNMDPKPIKKTYLLFDKVKD